MSNKTPISILQELMVQKKESLPDYYIEHYCTDLSGPSFKCTVAVSSFKAIAYGPTKKDAKQNSAKKALETLGYKMSSTSHQHIIPVVMSGPKKVASFINYVGKLNELASTEGKPYPTYYDDPIPSAGGIFLTTCHFLHFVSKGGGLKKKDAKQEAARSMLERLRTEDISLISTEIENLHLEKEKKIQTLTQEILKKYDTLSTSVSNITPITTFRPMPNLKKDVFSLEDFRRELEQYGYKYTIETFQKDPYIMMMKITDTNAVIMGKGENKQSALNDLFENVILMFDQGFSLKPEL